MENRGDISVESLTVTDSIKQRGSSYVNLDNSIEEGSGENDTVFVVIIAFLMTRSSRESIRFTHRPSGYVGDGEMEVREV